MNNQSQSQVQNLNKTKSINQDIALQENKTYSSAGLNSYLVRCYQKLGYKQPTPIQYYSISTYIQKKCPSIVAQSKSGTGKTLSYLSILLTHALTLSEISHRCTYLIILPTRELSLQVYQTFKEIVSAFTLVKGQSEQERVVRQKLKQIRAMMCIGGIPFEDDKRNYANNGGTVLIGTVGRILQFFDKKLIKIAEMQMLILDEGDKLFQNKNRKFVQLLQNISLFHVNQKYKIQILIYSATFTSKLMIQINKKREYLFIQTLGNDKKGVNMNITSKIDQLLELDNIVNQNVMTSDANINLVNIKKYKLIILSENQSFFNAKIASLIQLLHELKYQRCLVFVQKKTLLQQINERIIQSKLQSILIHGSLSQSSRIKMMNQINHSKIVIASDLLARGIDLQLDLVILFDAKKNDTFWHRIGRTGRYGSMGVAISLDDISDWKDYDREDVQKQLDQIQLSFDKNKEWYGTYLTEIGRWNQTNQQKQEDLQKQFKYFDESKFVKGRKIHKIDDNLQDKTIQPHHHQSDLLQSINRIQNQEQLKKLVSLFLNCKKCQQFITSVQNLTQYRFSIRNYSNLQKLK